MSKVRTSFRDRQRRALRQRLFDVALGLIRKRGFDSCTVQDITTAAGVSKGTFFNYFPTKEHVLAEYFASLTRTVKSKLPCTVGVPLIAPSLARARPAGSAPETMLQV